MLPIKKNFLPNGFVFDIEKLKEILLQNRWNVFGISPGSTITEFGERTHDRNSLKSKVHDFSRVHDFPVPEEPIFYLFHY